jgi:hypothetical protein
MQFLVVGLCECIAQGCCWYNVFRCCGCIEEENRHVEIEKQTQIVHLPNPKPVLKGSDNPFINPNAPKDAHISFSYKT